MSKGSEIQDLANILRGEGFGAEADKLVSKLEKGEKLSRSLEKQLKTISAKNNIELNKKLKLIREMEDDLADLNDEQKQNLRLLKESTREQERQNKTISNYIVSVNAAERSTSKFSDTQSKTSRNVNRAIDSITSHVSALGLLDAALTAVETIYESWFEQQRDWTRGMAEFAVRTGATTTQLQGARSAADAMRLTMQRLGGSLTGIEESIRFVGDASLAMRMEIGSMSEELQLDLLAAQRGLGMSADEAALMARTLQSGVEGGNESLGEFVVNMHEFAESIHANAATISRDFLDSRSALASFGEDGGEVFRRTATFANTLGFETRRVLDMFRQFDTFGAASDNINQLNSAFGTTISSFEVMSEEDPVRRIQMITDAIQSQGYDMANMTRQQIRMLANAMGVAEDEVGRLMNGEDMAAINAENAAAAAREAENTRTEARLREEILGIIEATEARFLSMREYVQLLINDVAEYLSPIFNSMRDSSEGIMDSIRGWVRSILGNQEFQQIIHNIADWIAEMPENIDKFAPTWEEIKAAGQEMWPVIRDIGEMIMSVVGFAVDHPEAVGIALGVLAVGQLLGGFGGIAALLSPGGVILAGIAAMALGLREGTAAADDMRSRMEAIRGSDPSLRTSSENAALTEGRGASLSALANAHDTNIFDMNGRMWGGLLEGAARMTGFEDTANMIERNTAVAGSSYDDMESNARSALTGGASVSDVVRAITANAVRGGPDADVRVRRTFGLTGEEDLIEGLTREVSAMSAEVAPAADSELSIPTSAVDSAPVTTTTATTPMAAMSSGGSRITTAAVNLDGRAVGSALFEISRS